MRTLCATSAKNEQTKYILCWFNPHFNNLYHDMYWSGDQVLLQAMVPYYQSDLPLQWNLQFNSKWTIWWLDNKVLVYKPKKHKEPGWQDLRLKANWCWKVASRQMMGERWWYCQCQVANHSVLFSVSTRYLMYLSEYVLFSLWLCSTWWCSSNFGQVGLIFNL